MSAPEDLLAFQLKAVGIPYEREVQFAKESKRRWRADFVVRRGPDCVECGGSSHTFHPPLLIEIDGGAFIQGRHSRGAGMRADMEKQNAAVLLGYRPLRFLPEQVSDGSALATIEQALGAKL